MLLAELILFVLAVAGAIYGIVYMVNKSYKNRLIAKTPNLELTTGGNSTSLIKKNREYYRELRHAVNLIDDLIQDDMVRPMIPVHRQKEMQRVVKQFDEL